MCVCVCVRTSRPLKGVVGKPIQCLALMDGREVTIPHDSYKSTCTLLHTPTHTHVTHMITQRSVGGAAGVMQRRLEELEAAIKKLEEDKAEMKQENASLVKGERERMCVCVM